MIKKIFFFFLLLIITFLFFRPLFSNNPLSDLASLSISLDLLNSKLEPTFEHEFAQNETVINLYEQTLDKIQEAAAQKKYEDVINFFRDAFIQGITLIKKIQKSLEKLTRESSRDTWWQAIEKWEKIKKIKEKLKAQSNSIYNNKKLNDSLIVEIQKLVANDKNMQKKINETIDLRENFYRLIHEVYRDYFQTGVLWFKIEKKIDLQ